MARGRHIVRLKAQPLTPESASFLSDWKAKELWDNPEKFPRLTSNDLFANKAPLEVEIGSSSGEFLCGLAEASLKVNFLGIEVSQRAAAYSASLAAELKLKNLHILRANFKFLAPLLVDESWSRVYLHFPDPIEKNKDEKRRVFDQTFLDQMARVLVEGGEISVVSDKPDFLQEMLSLGEKDTRFERTHEEQYLEFEPTAKSRFQRFWERKGIRPQRFVLRKR